VRGGTPPKVVGSNPAPATMVESRLLSSRLSPLNKGRIQLIRNRTAPWTVVHCAVFDSTMQRANPALPWGAVLGAGLIGRTVETVV
jgi:hypothetical protein